MTTTDTATTTTAPTDTGGQDKPERYVVEGGNVLWWDGQSLLGCYIRADGTPEWGEAYDVDPRAFAADGEYRRLVEVCKTLASLDLSG